MPTHTETRQSTINLRTAVSQKTLIDRAAEALGVSRSRFMLEASVQRAETVLSDRTRFVLDEAQMERFQEALSAPLPDADALKRLLGRPAPWTR